jgi:hypothetical protein
MDKKNAETNSLRKSERSTCPSDAILLTDQGTAYARRSACARVSACG